MDHDVNRRESVFNALYDTHYDAVRAYAWRRDPAFADDVVAETFLVAWRRLDDIPADAALPWLLGVARNALLNIRRSERRRREREKAQALGLAPHDLPPRWEPSDGTQGPLWQTLQLLSSADREVLLLVAWEGLDRAAIARVLGCSRANVALRLHRARRRFQELLESAGDSQELPSALSRERGPLLHSQGVSHD
jgi:RNA polymerase sigma-70 factor (ECF subfamily)